MYLAAAVDLCFAVGGGVVVLAAARNGADSTLSRLGLALILTLTLALTGLETEDAVKVAREAFDQVPRESFVSRLPTLSILFLRR